MLHTNTIVCSYQETCLTVPKTHLLEGSLSIEVPSKPQFTLWSEEDFRNTYSLAQKVVETWKNQSITDQYLMYAKIEPKTPFQWEIVPYKKCRTCVGRMAQQLQVLWRTAFGGYSYSKKQEEKAISWCRDKFQKKPTTEATNSPSKGQDAFCKQETIDRQVVFSGETVNVLFNYAPIGFGGEKLHFLIVPKNHRKTFSDVSEKEFTETLLLTKKIVDHFFATRKEVKCAYILNKTGKDSGQTVDHSHTHIIISTNAAQDFWGKVTVAKNILFGSSPMKPKALAQRVSDLRQELAGL